MRILLIKLRISALWDEGDVGAYMKNLNKSISHGFWRNVGHRKHILGDCLFRVQASVFEQAVRPASMTFLFPLSGTNPFVRIYYASLLLLGARTCCFYSLHHSDFRIYCVLGLILALGILGISHVLFIAYSQVDGQRPMDWILTDCSWRRKQTSRPISRLVGIFDFLSFSQMFGLKVGASSRTSRERDECMMHSRVRKKCRANSCNLETVGHLDHPLVGRK